MNQDLENLLVKALSEKLEGGKPATGDSRELLELQTKFLADKAERQTVGTVAGCLSFASPILPLGILGFFFLLGKMDGLDKGPLEQGKRKNGLRAQMARIAAAEALALARKKKWEADKENGVIGETTSLTGSALKALISTTSDRRPVTWNAEKRVIPKQGRLSAEKGYFVTKDKMARAKQLKEHKLLLEALMEKQQTKQNFSAVSEISSRLESLEKLVRQLLGGTNRP